MAWRLLYSVLLILNWACVELIKVEQSGRTYGYGRSLNGEFYGLPENHDDAPFYLNYNAGYDYPESEITTHLRDLHNASSTFGDFNDRHTDVDFEDIPGTAIIKEVTFSDKGTLSDGFAVICGYEQMTVRLPAGPTDKIKILGSKGFTSAVMLPKSCGYLKEGLEHNTLTMSFKGCPFTHKNGQYTVKLLYSTYDGRNRAVNATCSDSSPSSWLKRPLSDQPLLQDMSTGRQKPFTSKCRSTNAPPKNVPASPVPKPQFGVKVPLTQSVTKTGCSIPPSQHLRCGPSTISTSLCLAKGCCVDPKTSSCFYPMDECTVDKTFVFAVRRNDTVDPSSLFVVGKDKCAPVLRSSDFAIFKFSVTECGTRSYMVGNMEVYMAEVQSTIKVYNLKYGAITRDSYFRLLLECRYPKSGALGMPFLITAGYMVKSPSWPSTVTSKGLYGVQLRIATDRTYTKFYPQDHQPLRMMLGKSVFLEVSLITKDSSAVLLVNYCLAYPRSATNALVLLYEGCPNNLDGNATVLHTKGLTQTKQKRRFEIKTFQFLDLKTKKYIEEEIYFMCSTEVCFPSEKPCVERCFG